MKKLIAIIVLTMPALAFAQSPFQTQPQPQQQQYGNYFSFQVGAVFPEDSTLRDSGGGSNNVSFDTGYLLGAAIGSHLGYGLRAEAEFDYRNADVDKVSGTPAAGKFETLSLMGNVYQDFAIGGPIEPFIGAGLGGAVVRVDDGLDTDDDWVFAYQVMAGVNFIVDPHTTFTLGYRYFGTSDPSLDVGGRHKKATVQMHNIMASFRYSF